MHKTILALFVAALLGLFSNAAFADHKPGHKSDPCAGDCKSCYTMCEEKLDYFLKKGGKHADPDRVQLMRDCITICKANEDFKTRGSANAGLLAKVCADICAKCAKSCEALNDDSLRDCIAMCKKCSDSCKTMDKNKKAAADTTCEMACCKQ